MRVPPKGSYVKRPIYDGGWPESWRLAYSYDEEEIWGNVKNRGYAYAYQNRRSRTIRFITEVASPGARVLDLAAAQGNFSLALAEMGYDVTWNDLRGELIDYVRLKYERGRLSFLAGNIFEQSVNELFDVIVITEVIEHVAHPDDFLRKVSGFVKPGGHIVLTTPNGAYFRNTLPRFSDCPNPEAFESIQFRPNSDGHIFLLHPDEILDLSDRAGLQVDRLELFTTPLMNGYMKMEYLLKIFPRVCVEGVDRVASLLPEAVAKRLFVHLGARLRRE